MGIEGAEEVASYVGNYIADVAFRDPNAEFSLKEMLLAGLGGMISGGILGMTGTFIGAAANRYSGQNHNTQVAQTALQAGTGANAVWGAASAALGWIDGYSEQEAQNLSSHKGIVNEKGMGFPEFAQKARMLGNGIRFYFGKVSGKLARAISSATGMDLTGYNIAIRSDEVVHSYRNHGNAETEALRGHLPVNEQTIAQLPRVFENPDEVVMLPEKDYAGRTAFEVRKNLDGYVVAVVGVADGRHSIEIDSVRIIKKKGAPTTVNNALRAQDQTSETGSGQHLSSDSTLPQTAEGVKVNPGAVGREGPLGGNPILPDTRAENSGGRGLYLTNPNVQGMSDAHGRARLSRRTQRVLGALSGKLGVGIVVDATGGGNNGYYDAGSRTIHLSADAKDPLGVVLSHEITHRLKEASPSEYLAFARMAQEQLRAAGKYDSLALRVRDAYGELSPDALADEMTAHYAQSLVTDIGEFERLAGVNRSLAQRLLDWLDEFLHKTRLSLQGLSAQEQNEILKDFTFHEVEAARKAWAEALRRADSGAKGHGWRRMSIQTLPDGKRIVVIDTDQHIFDGIPQNQYPAVARKYIKEHFMNAVLPVGEYDVAKVGKKTPGEYAYPADVPNKTENIAKMRASTELANLLEVSEYSHSGKDAKGHGHAIASLGWDYYTVRFSLGGKMFEGVVNIANSDQGRIFYDITKIKEVPGMSNTPSTPMATSAYASGNLINTNLPQTAEGVNPNSTQEGKQYSRPLGPEEARIKRNRQMARTHVALPAQEEHRSAIEQNAEAAVRQAYISNILVEKWLLQQLRAAKAAGVVA